MSGVQEDKGLLRGSPAATGGPRPFPEPGQGPTWPPDRFFELEHLHVRLRVDVEGRAIQGEARVTVAPLPTGMGPIDLHLDEVDALEVSRADGSPVAWHRHGRGVRIEGLVDRTEVALRWRARPRRGMYFVPDDAAAGGPPTAAWTQFQDEDAHHVLPCFDHPSVKHPARLEIEAPEGYEVVSCGVLEARTPLEDGHVRWVWVQERPVPAYLLTIVVARLDVVEDEVDGLPLRYLVPAGWGGEEEVRRVFGRTPEMIRYFSRLFGQPFAWPRYDQVVVRGFIFGGMENAGATTLTDLVLTDPEAARVVDMDRLIAHELAHQWFGDLVTCRDWSQAWLNEGWATVSEVLWREHHLGRADGVWTAYACARSYFEEAGTRYRRPIVEHRFREPLDLFDRHLYEKAACVLHTLRHELGDEAFFAGARAWLARFADSTGRTEEFQRVYEEVSGRSLEGFFRQWVHAPGHPVVEVELAWSDGLLQVTVRQRQEGEGVPEAFHFRLRVEVGEEHWDLPVRSRERTFALPLAREPSAVRVDPGFRVLADLSLAAPRPWLVRLLGGDDCPVLRARAARALARTAEPEGVEALVGALGEDPAWQVRAEVAGLLGAIGGSRVAAALAEALGREEDPRPREAIVRALGRSGAPEAAEVLLRVAEGEEPSIYALGAVVPALAELRHPATLEVGRRLLDRPSWGDTVACLALEGLGASRRPEAFDDLVAWLRPPRGERARAAAARALGELATSLPELRSRAVDALIDVAREAPLRLAVAVAAALGRLEDDRARGVLRRLHEAAPDGRVRRAAWEALDGMGRTPERVLTGLREELERLRREHRRLRDRIDREAGPGAA